MIVIGAVLAGVVTGIMLARRHGGRAADMAQYAAACGIAFGLVGLFATIILARSL
jgi:hypothetical protein